MDKLSVIFVRVEYSEYYYDIVYQAVAKKFMLKPVKILILFTLSMVMPLASLQSHGIEPGHSHKPLLLARTSGMSLDQAVDQVRKQTGGRILSAKTVTKKGRRFHRIKVLMPSGRVKIIHKPAG